MIEKEEIEIKVKLFETLIQCRKDWDELVVATNVNKIYKILKNDVI